MEHVGRFGVILLAALVAGCGSGASSDSDENSLEACQDGIDNDEDGLVDCDDPDCAGFDVCRITDARSDSSADAFADVRDDALPDSGRDPIDASWPDTPIDTSVDSETDGKPDTPLTASVQMIGERPTLVINGKPRDPLLFFGSNSCVSQPTRVNVTSSWEVASTEFVAPKDVGAVTIHVQLGTIAGTVWIDDISFVDLADGKERIRSGGFDEPDNGTGWKNNFTFVPWGDAAATAKVEAGALRVDITKPGTAGWHVQVSQKGHSIADGHRYRLSARMRASAARTVDLGVVRSGDHPEYYTDWPGCPPLREVRRAAKAGIHLHSFNSPNLWPDGVGGAPQLKAFDRFMTLLVEADPAGLFLPRFSIISPWWWNEAHETERMVFEDEQKGQASVASKIWLADAEAQVRAVVRHGEKHWGDRIIGYHPTAQETGEWFYSGSWYGKLPSFETPMRDAFRTFVSTRYKNDVAALRTAWGDSTVTFDTLEVPTAKQRRAGGPTEVLRNAATERRLIDWDDFQNEVMMTAVARMARAIKDETQRRKLSVMFYGYVHELSGLPNGPQSGGHLATSQLLANPDIDVLVSPVSYIDRGLGGTAPFMPPIDSIALHGKLWLNEDDTRTHLSGKAENYGRVDTPEHTSWIHRRNFGNLLTRGIGTWWMDLQAVGWLDDDKIWADIGVLRTNAYLPELTNPTGPHRPEIAVIVDEASLSYLKYSGRVSRPLLYYIRRELNRIGAPVGYYLLDDLLADRVPAAKMYVMLNLFTLDYAKRAAVQAKVRRDGRVTIWFYAPGYFGAKSSAIESVLEMPVVPLPTQIGEPVATWKPAATHGLLSGMAGEFGANDEDNVDETVTPLFGLLAGSAPDGPVTTLATWKNTSHGAVLVRKAANYTTIYAGTLTLPTRFFHNVAKSAGVWLWADAGTLVQTNGRWLSVTPTDGTVGQSRALRFPEPVTVINVVSGATIGTNTKSLTVKLANGEPLVAEMRKP